MRLKRLELQGFKSFAKKTTLEFPGAVSAIVGPNGSGKSNVAESIRWVLGEQSLKSLRGKRGEDLIFHGSSKRAKMSKAQAELVFSDVDSSVLGFDEVRIARVVYRDGINEYTINDSKVRLKDVVELILKLGLSRSAHNIIGQGESDRILRMSAEERRSIVEHTLGLEIYKFKRDEAEKKLNQTKENLRESQLLRREISPHLKFLEGQTKKALASREWREELRRLVADYVYSMDVFIRGQEKEFEKESAPLVRKKQALEQEISELQNKLARFDEQIDKSESLDFEALAEIDKKIRSLSLEFGRLEGQLQTKNQDSSSATLVDSERLMDLVDSLRADISAALENQEIEILVSTLEGVLEQLERFMMEFEDGVGGNEEAELSLQKDRLEKELERLEAERVRMQTEVSKRHEKTLKSQQETRLLHIELNKKQKDLEETKDRINTFSLTKEKIRIKRDELDHIRREYATMLESVEKKSPDSSEGSFDEAAQRETLRRIEKLKIKIEEAGGIDESVVKEYEETKRRDEFLVVQTEDLKAALEKTKKLVESLEVQINQEFKGGLSTINAEFQKLFSALFEESTASLELVEIDKPTEDEESMGVEETAGLDIKINIPRKRIRSLYTLSGGERVLTSIALLFALTQVTPPPFLVLDEVDAALDEANSARFGKLLRELSQKTQLIIITHNRETMRHASALYGVTMGSDGISKLLSVKFEEAKGLAAA